MIDWKLDGFLPTERQPAPVLESADDRDVLFARGAAAAIDLFVCYVLIEFPLIYALSLAFSEPYEELGGYVVVLSLLALLPIYATYSFVLEWRYGRTPGRSTATCWSSWRTVGRVRTTLAPCGTSCATSISSACRRS